MQSWGSFAFNIRVVENPGFSAFAVVGKTFELATLAPTLFECGE
jgi:hypothetical protein